MDQESLIILFTFLAFIFFAFKFIRKVMKGGVDHKLAPGPWKLPILGHIHHLAGKLPHHALRDLAIKHGPIIHLQLAEASSIVISSPSLAKEVMKSHDLAFADRPASLATTIFTYNNTDIAFCPYGDYWRQMRKICTLELLSAKKVKSFCPIREDECWKLIDSIRSSSGRAVNLSDMIYTMINSVTCRSVFGSTCKDQKAFVKLMKEMTYLSGGFDVVDLFPSIKLLHSLTGTKDKIVKIHDKVDQILGNIISEHEESGMINNHDKMEGNLLHVLLRNKNGEGIDFPLTLDNVKAVIMDIFIAGTDTSSTTIEWAMSEIIRHPRVMEKVQAELRQGLEGKDTIKEADIQELSYLKLVIKETLRLHPPVPLSLPRKCREECKVGGFHVPVKTKVIINMWAIMRDPQHWKDGESFVPERFENLTGTEFEYIPFGGGRRMCPGSALGLANIELPLAQLLYHFDWKLPSGMTAPEDIDMTEDFGVTVKRKNDLILVPIIRLDHTMDDSC